MKTLSLPFLIACTMLFFACNPSPTSKNAGAGGASQQDSLLIRLGGNADEPMRISAGRALGILHLKNPADTLFSLFGKADSVAADMCKDLSAWHSENARLRVYSLCDNDLDMRKSMQVIGVSGAAFVTVAGLNEQSTFAEIRQIHPGLEILGKVTSGQEPVFITDEVEKGIAFELSDTSANGRVLGVLIHLPGKPLTRTTIPFYPDMEQ